MNVSTLWTVEDEGDRFIRNVGKFRDATSHPGTLQYSTFDIVRIMKYKVLFGVGRVISSTEASNQYRISQRNVSENVELEYQHVYWSCSINFNVCHPVVLLIMLKTNEILPNTIKFYIFFTELHVSTYFRPFLASQSPLKHMEEQR